ncbi:MAG: VanZ family protein [Desulfatiglans sp.]|jgi:VanZ family protein|nr:VanZ family protein [Desulfatiglans sp.]
MGNNKRDRSTGTYEAISEERVLRYSNLWRAIAYLIIISIIVLSLIPNPDEVTPFSASDKVLHTIAYAVCMFWFGLCYGRDKLYIIGLILIVLGIVIEIIQGQTGYRDMSLYDIFANIAGVLIGFLLSFSRLSWTLHYFEKLLFR